MAQRISFTTAERHRLLAKQNYHCASSFCLHPYLLGRPFDVDHKIPLMWDGTNDEDNLQVLCVECHRNKTDRENRIRHSANQAIEFATGLASLHMIQAAVSRIVSTLPSVSDEADAGNYQIVHYQAEGEKDVVDSPQRKRKRRDRGEYRSNATPLREHEEMQKWRRKILKRGVVCGITEMTEECVDSIIQNLYYVKNTDGGRQDNYFFVNDEIGPLRSAQDIVSRFFPLGLAVSHSDSTGQTQG